MQAGEMNTMKKCSACGTLFAGDLCPKCMAGFAQRPTDPTMPPEELPLRPGQSFHGMEILELLGRGGMGVVYKARQPALDRLVALKILPQKMALDPDFQGRFIREAKALGSLNHPNIVAVYDFGAEAGLFFFVMEFVDGTNLRQILRDRKIAPEHALKLVPQLCDALEYAHEEGVVHRDIKPENILLDKKGRVKIADFGLAKLIGADVAAAGMLTLTNTVMGTPHYMAPEQVENPKSVDHRADIYSIGVVFYEMLTGELPIGRFELPSKKVQIDVRLDDVVLKALEKAPERRYQKASDVKDAVTRATSVASTDAYSPTVITPVPAKKASNRPMLIMGGVTALAVIVAFVAIFHQPKPNVTVTQTPTPTATAPPEPPKPEPVDFTKLYFGPEERPLGYIFLSDRELKNLPRNPLHAKDATELSGVVKFLSDFGLQNLSPSDLKQAYVSVWWGCSFFALETPLAERLEREVNELKIPNRWAYRKGSLLAFVFAGRREERAKLNALVAMAQKKLGLPIEPPDIPFVNLTFEKNDLPSGWSMKENIYESGRGGEQQYQAFFATEGKSNEVTLELNRHTIVGDAELALKELRQKWPLTADVLRSGRIVAALVRRSDHLDEFMKMRERLRSWMGLPQHSFETIVPNESELPKGYAFEKVETDANVIAKDLESAKPAEVRAAWRASFKPAGKVVLLETSKEVNKSALESELKKLGPAGERDHVFFAVQAAEDETLDVLENLMRVKFGWDRKAPRAIEIRHAQFKPGDLPEGFTLANEALQDRRGYSCQINGPQFTLQCRMIETFDYGYEKITAAKKAMPYVPGDILLVKDTVVVWVGGGGEASWPALEILEATLRKKMRMGPPKAEDFGIQRYQLPEGALFAHEGSKPISGAAFGSRTEFKLDAVSSWSEYVEPSGTYMEVLELKDPVLAAKCAKEFIGMIRTDGQTGEQYRAAFAKGPFLALVAQLPKRDEAVFKSFADQLRAKLRVAKP
jgi:serine/threonine protein kinase